MQKRSRKVFLLFTFIILLTFTVCCFAGCKFLHNNNETLNPSNSNIVFTGVKDVRISVSETEFDFKSGVTAKDKQGNALEVSVDANNVKFGTPGKYEITYKALDGNKSADVYIYGLPTIETETLTLTYKQVMTADTQSIAKQIEAKDTFNEKVDISIEMDLIKSNGSAQTGEGQIKVFAIDTVGNIVSKDILITVQEPSKTYTFAEQNIDFAKAYATFELSEGELLSVYVQEQNQGEEVYACQNGYFMLLPALFSNLGVGQHTLVLNFDECSSIMVCNVTDNQSLAVVEDFSINNQTFVVGDTLVLPTIGKAEYSIQDFTIDCYLQKVGSKREPIDKQEQKLTGNGDYKYIAEIKKENRVVETRIQQFTVISQKEALGQNLVQSRYLECFSTKKTNISYVENVVVNSKTVNAFHIKSTNKADKDNSLSFTLTILKDLITKGVENGYTTLKLTMYSPTNSFAGYVEKTATDTLKAYDASINKTYMIDVYQGADVILSFFDVNGGQVDTYITNMTFTKIDFTTNVVNDELIAFKAFTFRTGVSGAYEEKARINDTTSLDAIHITSTENLPEHAGKHNGDYMAINYFTLNVDLLNLAKEKGFTTVSIVVYTDNQIDVARGNILTQVETKYRNNKITEPTTIELNIDTYLKWGIYFVLGSNGTLAPANIYITNISFSK